MLQTFNQMGICPPSSPHKTPRLTQRSNLTCPASYVSVSSLAPRSTR